MKWPFLQFASNHRGRSTLQIGQSVCSSGCASSPILACGLGSLRSGASINFSIALRLPCTRVSGGEASRIGERAPRRLHDDFESRTDFGFGESNFDRAKMTLSREFMSCWFILPSSFRLWRRTREFLCPLKCVSSMGRFDSSREMGLISFEAPGDDDSLCDGWIGMLR